MNYTTNYHLPQWVESDRIMMEDFNQMCADIEEGLNGAQTTADAAQSTAGAAFCPSNMPFVTGTYTGTGTDITIELGFRPSFVIISGSETGSSATSTSFTARNFFTGGNVLTECITFTDTGFIVNRTSNSIFPQGFTDGRVYDYIAFK